MRILKIAVLIVVAAAYIANIYAEYADEIIVVQKTEASQIPQNDDQSRIAAYEKEIQQLTGRIEVLEHTVQELKKHQTVAALVPADAATQTAPTVSPSVSVDAQVQAVASDAVVEKREYDIALAALKDSNFQEAENMFSAFMQKYPSSSLISNAYFWYAESFYRRGEFDKSAVHYLKGYKQFPKAAKAADSLFKLALSLGELKKNKEACVILNKLEEEFKQRPASSIKRAYDAKMKYGCK